MKNKNYRSNTPIRCTGFLYANLYEYYQDILNEALLNESHLKTNFKAQDDYMTNESTFDTKDINAHYKNRYLLWKSKRENIVGDDKRILYSLNIYDLAFKNKDEKIDRYLIHYKYIKELYFKGSFRMSKDQKRNQKIGLLCLYSSIAYYFEDILSNSDNNKGIDYYLDLLINNISEIIDRSYQYHYEIFFTLDKTIMQKIKRDLIKIFSTIKENYILDIKRDIPKNFANLLFNPQDLLTNDRLENFASNLTDQSKKIISLISQKNSTFFILVNTLLTEILLTVYDRSDYANNILDTFCNKTPYHSDNLYFYYIFIENANDLDESGINLKTKQNQESYREGIKQLDKRYSYGHKHLLIKYNNLNDTNIFKGVFVLCFDNIQKYYVSCAYKSILQKIYYLFKFEKLIAEQNLKIKDISSTYAFICDNVNLKNIQDDMICTLGYEHCLNKKETKFNGVNYLIILPDILRVNIGMAEKQYKVYIRQKLKQRHLQQNAKHEEVTKILGMITKDEKEMRKF